MDPENTQHENASYKRLCTVGFYLYEIPTTGKPMKDRSAVAQRPWGGEETEEWAEEQHRVSGGDDRALNQRRGVQHCGVTKYHWTVHFTTANFTWFFTSRKNFKYFKKKSFFSLPIQSGFTSSYLHSGSFPASFKNWLNYFSLRPSISAL